MWVKNQGGGHQHEQAGTTTLSSLWSRTGPSWLMTDTSASRSVMRSSRPLAGVFFDWERTRRGSVSYIPKRAQLTRWGPFSGGGAMSIHTRLATAVSAAVVAAALALPASAATSIPLNSGQEPAGGEAGGHGFFSYTIEDNQFCWTLSWQGIAEPFAGHVHLAPRGVAGPVVIDLNADGVGGPDKAGCSEIDAELAAAITSDPGAYYVNLHNDGFEAGAIRGQLK
jgi:CHRD domain